MRNDMDRAEITFRPYVGVGRDRLPSATLRHYRNLRRHRSTILEGVRRIAVRNINHLTRTMNRLGIQDLRREGDAKAVFNVLFEEQGMGADVNSRPMVDYINMIPWEMYLCLLYVELESYRSASRRDPSLAFGPLEELFDSKSAAIEDLKTVRDKVLHPVKGIELGDALDSFMEAGARFDGHYFKLVFDAQRRLDAYCSWLRASLSRLVAIERAAAASPSGQQRGMAAKLQMAKAALSGPLPQFIGERDDGALQTPFDLRKWLILGLNQAGDGRSGLSYPAFLRRAKTDCNRMLMRSLVFLNEFVHLIDFQKLRAVRTRAELDAHEPFEFLEAETSTMTEQQIEDLHAPVRVSNALLAEPLRLYFQAVKEAPSLRDRALEEIAGAGPMSPVLGRYRNIVFHVGSDGADPTKSELEFLEQMEEAMNSLSLLPRLLSFFMTV